METQMPKVRLGRKALKTDSRTLKMFRYFTTELPPAPPSVNWTKNIENWGMMLNDTLGDCTIAGCGHAIQGWSANSYCEITVPDDVILQYYEQWCGYDPSDPSTDQGGVELDVLKNWKKHGFASHKILGFADPAVTDLNEIRQSINLFGGVYIGFQVPNFLMSGDSIPEVWDIVEKDGGIDGGHCVFVLGYDDTYFYFISWGKVYKMTILFWQKYVDEAHAVFGQDWLNAQKAPNGFDIQQLTADLAAIR
jgi:hypothetical protein